jgi:murein DD-endopeptidase MepM/ murein hydrolase activator NlpD
LGVLIALVVSACGTVSPTQSGRKGLFDSDRAPSAFRAPSISYGHLRPRLANWVWPVKEVQVTSKFGSRGGGEHEGIDLRAAVGTPVVAAEAGTVSYSGSKLRGYGKLIIIKHGGGLSTVYAHNSKLVVRKGQRVKRGQKIALAGKSGRSTGPHVHFEVRRGDRALDPLQVMPSPRYNYRRIAALEGRQ